MEHDITWTPFREKGTGTVIDTRDSGSDATSPAYFALGAACCGSHRWYDHVCVGDATNGCPDPAGFEVPAELSDFVLD